MKLQILHLIYSLGLLSAYSIQSNKLPDDDDLLATFGGGLKKLAKKVNGRTCPTENLKCSVQFTDEDYTYEEPNGNFCWFCAEKLCICQKPTNDECPKHLLDIRKCKE